ncbi:hypothetical protein UlMin_005424 [Ulmus minor]
MPLGRITLRVVFGVAPCQASVSVNFLVVDSPSVYNTIIGRETLHALRAVASTYHMLLKFPTPNGIGVVDGAQTVSRETYELATIARFRQIEPISTKRRNPGECLQVGTVDHVDYGVITGAIQLGSLDPRDDFYEQRGSPVEDLEEVQFNPGEPGKTFKIGRLLREPLRTRLIGFLREHENDFAWTHHDIPGIDPTVMIHSLAVDPKARPIKQKRRSFNPERYAAINAEVEKLVEAGSIREVQYPEWVTNVVLVKKSSGKWRVCTDFTDLNKACPKDSFPLPRIDQLVDATAGHELLSFMDAYSGYNQIRMDPKDEEKTSFITNQGLYCYNLNPAKCAFGVASGKFLGFMVHQRGIEANPEKIQALLDMRSPVKIRDVQSLTGRIAALNRFIARATDRSLPFFKALKRGVDFVWTDECERSFQELKEYLGKAPVLSKPMQGETLILYLAVSEAAVSSVLIRLENNVELPVFYVSRALLDPETRYPEAEKVALALVTAARKIRPYFQAHAILVYTKAPLRQVLQNPECSGRLAKWAIELSKFDIEYKPRTSIKGQAVADFISEFTRSDSVLTRENPGEDSWTNPVWKLFVDGSTNQEGSGIGIVLESPKQEKVFKALRLEFPVSNNEAEYEALLTVGFRTSQCRISGAGAKDGRLPATRAEYKNSELPVDILCSPSTDGTSINQVDEEPTWMTPIVGYLLRGELPQDRTEARTLRMRAARYTYLAGQLYKRGFSNPLLKCVTPDQGLYIMREIHEGVCGNHAGKRSLLHKIELNSVLSPWPFAKWGIDLIGPLPLGKYRMKFVVVAIDYYTKWVEAEPLSEITEARTTSFVWKNIVCRFGIPHSLVSDNGTQFDSTGLKKLCSELGIRKHFASVAHPQSNGQVEAVNKTIKRNLERKLEGLKNAWVEELPRVLWAYRTTSRTATGETPFSMTYGTEAVLPVEVGEPSFRTIRFDSEVNNQGLALNLDLVEIKRDEAVIRIRANQAAAARSYNPRVRIRRFEAGDLVLKKVA